MLTNLNSKLKFSEIDGKDTVIGKCIKDCGRTNEGSVNSLYENEKLRESYREEIIFELDLDE